jgi:hypothetical protein
VSYTGQEASREGGSPVEVYDFSIGAVVYRHTSGEDPVTLGGDLYTPLAIDRENIRLGGEERTQPISVTMPSTHLFPQLYVIAVPGQRATVTIRRFHRFDSPGVEVVEIFKGRVQSVGFEANGLSAKVVVMPLTGAHSRTIPLFVFSSLCNHILGQTPDNGNGGCPVDLEAGVSPVNGLPFKFSGAVSAVSANTITLPGANAFPVNWFTGGFVKTASLDYRLVLSHSGNNLKLLVPFTEDVLGDTVTVYAGCDHRLVTCATVFNVADDFGGYPYVPLLNPFTTSL